MKSCFFYSTFVCISEEYRGISDYTFQSFFYMRRLQLSPYFDNCRYRGSISDYIPTISSIFQSQQTYRMGLFNQDVMKCRPSNFTKCFPPPFEEFMWKVFNSRGETKYRTTTLSKDWLIIRSLHFPMNNMSFGGLFPRPFTLLHFEKIYFAIYFTSTVILLFLFLSNKIESKNNFWNALAHKSSYMSTDKHEHKKIRTFLYGTWIDVTGYTFQHLQQQ